MRIPLPASLLALQALGGIAQPIPKHSNGLEALKNSLIKRALCIPIAITLAGVGLVGATIGVGTRFAHENGWTKRDLGKQMDR